MKKCILSCIKALNISGREAKGMEPQMVKRLKSNKLYGIILRAANRKQLRNIYREHNSSKAFAAIRMIGVAGLCDGAGTTQLCITLATLMGRVLKRSTAVIGDEGTYSRMLRQLPQARAVKHKGIGTRHAFCVDGIDYYCGMQEDYTGVLRRKYDVVIQDISLSHSEDTLARTTARLSACDIKILTGSMLPWKSKECEKKLERIGHFLDIRGLNMVTLTMCGSEDIKIVEKLGVRVIPMPFERNPFAISGANLLAFMEIFKIK